MSKCKNWQNGRDSTDPEIRFWDKTNKNGPNGCWEWMACLRRGYGILSVNKRAQLAHRFSWELHNGPIPKGMHICHHCDNPKCVNPDHLFIGTHQDNMQDMVAKGRAVKGERVGGSKLSETQVRVIRNYLNVGVLEKCLARSFGVSRSTIGDIKHRRIWAHI